MSSDKSVVMHLNTILGNELVAINQYFLHSRMLKKFGYEVLSAKSYSESIDEMKHADSLINRILFLDGIPNVQNLGKLYIGETVSEMLQCDLELEHKAVNDLKNAIEVTDKQSDFVSSALLQDILSAEEEHVDFLTTQLKLIDTIGLELYLQKQI